MFFTGGSGKVYRRLLLFQPPPVLVLRIDRFRMVHIIILYLHFAVFFLMCPLEGGETLFLSIFILRSSISNRQTNCVWSFFFPIIFFYNLCARDFSKVIFLRRHLCFWDIDVWAFIRGSVCARIFSLTIKNIEFKL